SGQVEPGNTVNSIIITDSNGNSLTVDPADISVDPTTGVVTVSGQDLSSLVDGTLTVTMNVTDVAGNSGDVTDTTVLDTTAPGDSDGENSINFLDGGDELVNGAESVNVPLSGQVEPGNTVNSIIITDSNGNSLTVDPADISVDPTTGVVTVSGQDLSGLDDGTLTVTMNVTDVAGNSGNATDTTVLELAATVSVTASPISINEEGANNTSEVTFTLTAPSSTDTTLTVTLTGTAADGTDYEFPATVVIPAGDTSVTVDLTALSDDIVEGDETVIITVTGTDNDDITAGTNNQATVTIVDTDDTGTNPETATVSVTASPISINEEGANNTSEVTFTLTAPSSTDTTLTVTLTGTAADGTDYEFPATVVIPAGDTSVTVDLTALSDDIVEGDETVIITVTGTDNDDITAGTNNQATVTIVDTGLPKDDSQTINEDSVAIGNVLTNDEGVNSSVMSFTIAGVSGSFIPSNTPIVIAGIGELILQANGNYAFTPADNWFGVVPTITYTTNTGESANLDINVTSDNDIVEITPANALNLEEAGLASAATVTDAGSVFITANDGLLDVVINFNGVDVTVWQSGGANNFPVTIEGEYGQLVVTGYDAATGKLSYEYVISDAQDHTQATNDILSESFEVTATDIDGDQAQTTITANVIDDQPDAETTVPDTDSIDVEVASFTFTDLSANWESNFNGGRNIERYNSDSVTGNDQVRWGGNGDTRAEKSGYGFLVNSSGLSGSLDLNQDILLGEFTHYNRSVPSGSAIGDGDDTTADATLTLSFTINGVVVSFQIQVSHNETPNSGSNPNDIITVLNPIQIIDLNGTQFAVNILGFYPSGSTPDGNPTRVIETIENQANPFDLYARIVPGDNYQLPQTQGNILNGDNSTAPDDLGADGAALSSVSFGNTTIEFNGNSAVTINGLYGTLLLNSDGSYIYTLTAGTNDIPDGAPAEIFTYTVTDQDGDTSSSTLTIQINEVDINGQPIQAPIAGRSLDANAVDNIESEKSSAQQSDDRDGVDIYQWQEGDEGTDHISDFDLQADKLILSDLLQGQYENSLENYFQFSLDGDSTVISIDADQDGDYEQEIVLDGVNLFKEYGLSELDIINGLIGDNGDGPLILETQSATAAGSTGYFDNSTPLLEEKQMELP
ncbi:Ig-like domain-containing protein, partial [Shewanella sp. NIFS-20-20]|uniref:Ig-like domain-containing protein n=1 Tax=Shewanella sp. NIFS-20-20 TaxID=2853806 RepID=UPI001C47ED05